MARRTAVTDQYGEPLPGRSIAHLRALGVRTFWEYLSWCDRCGFDGDISIKSKKQLAVELERKQTDDAQRKLIDSFDRKPRAFISSICNDEIAAQDIRRDVYREAALAIQATDLDKRESLKEMLNTLIAHGNQMFDRVGPDGASVIVGLIKLHDRKSLWLRPLDEFKPRTKSRNRWFGELTHHLLDQYGDVPRFMESVWLRTDQKSWRFRDWYVHLGRGFNLRTAKSPVPLTKKIAHWFLKAPDDYTPEQAIRFGQMSSLGASRASIDAVAGSRLGRGFGNEEFWLTFMQWLVENPMLDPRQISPIIDYVQHQRFETAEVQVEWGQVELQGPPQPNLTMRNRSATTLLGQVDEWHRTLNRAVGFPGNRLDPYPMANVNGLVVRSGQEHAPVVHTIRQIRNFDELVREGDELSHCVASYHGSLANKVCTLWSLSVDRGQDGRKRLQTIEVDNSGTIVQCRGKANRDPKDVELKVIRQWAKERGLKVANYL